MKDSLLISIYSFGFHKSGIPPDPSGHGGGFVFDCRGLPNPGREPLFAEKTGQDDEVVQYLESFPEVRSFLGHVLRLVELTATNYRERQFDHLMVSFGCTGGQHRSVYCSEKIAGLLREKGFRVQLIHIDKPTFSS